MALQTAVTVFGIFFLIGLAISFGTGITYRNKKNKGFRDHLSPQIDSIQDYMVPDREEHSNSPKNEN